jgi:peptide/nickel transport system permease protein
LKRWRKEWEVQLKEYYDVLGILVRNPLSVVGLIIVVSFILIAILAQIIAPYPGDMIDVHPERRLLPPSLDHPFGTDEMGRDILSRVILGAQISLKIIIFVVSIAAIIGIVLGGVAGFLGGIVDEVLMRITDMFLAFPSIILAMAIAAALGPSLMNTMIAIIITWWPWYARLVRGQVLSIREMLYIEAAKALGLSRTRIIFRHILPNCLSPVIVQMSLDAGYVILTAAGLSFIGLGAQPPTPEWGLMISTGRIYMPQWWWCSVFPGLAIMVTVLGFNLIGDVIRDVLEPRMRQ